MDNQDDSSIEKIIEEEETSRVKIKRTSVPDEEEDSVDFETSVVEESSPDLEPRPSARPSNGSRDSSMRWSASGPPRGSSNGPPRGSSSGAPRGSSSGAPRGLSRGSSWMPLPEDVRPARSRSDSHLGEYGPVRKWAVDYNNRNYIRSFCNKPTGNHRRTLMGRTYDWDVDYDNVCYIRSLIRAPKGRHRKMKEIPRKTVPDNDILADSTGWEFDYGHDFPQVEEDVPYTAQERVIARGAYRCYGVKRSQSDTLLKVDIERELLDDFREDEYKHGREFLQEDMPLMYLGKDDRRTLRGGYRFYDVDRSKCDQYLNQDDYDGYDGEAENIPEIPQEKKFKRTVLKKTLQYPKQLTDHQFGVGLSFVPGEGSDDSLEGISTTLPSLMRKKRGVRDAFKRPKATHPSVSRGEESPRRDSWKRSITSENRQSRPPPLREEALRRASKKAEMRRSVRGDSDDEYVPKNRNSYWAQEEKRLSRIRNGVTRAELAFQPKASFEYEKVKHRPMSFMKTAQPKRSFMNEERRSMRDEEQNRSISHQRRQSSFRDEDSYRKSAMMDNGLEKRVSGPRRRLSLRDEDSFQERERMEEERDRRISNQKRRSSIRDEEPYQARIDNERVRRFSEQSRKPSRSEYQDDEQPLTSTPIRRTTGDTMGRHRSSAKEHPRLSHDRHQASLYDENVRRISDQVRRVSRGSKDQRAYQGVESEEGEEGTFESTAVLGRRPTGEERSRSSQLQPRMVQQQVDESDEGEDTFVSTAVFGRKQTNDGIERRRTSVKNQPMVYQGGYSDEEEETFASTAVFGRRPTNDVAERRRTSHKMSYDNRQQSLREQPRTSSRQASKELPRMVHQASDEEDDDELYTSAASWGNTPTPKRGSRNSGQVNSSMASRKGDRSSKSVGSNNCITSEREETCLRTRSKRRLETIESEEKTVRQTDRIVRNKSDRNIRSKENRYHVEDNLERMAQDNRNGSMYEDRSYRVGPTNGEREDQRRRSRANSSNNRLEVEKRSSSRSPYARPQPKSPYRENSQCNYTDRGMNKTQLVRQRKEIQSRDGYDFLDEFREHRHHPKDYGEYAEDGYEKFLDENGSEVYEKVKKKSSKLHCRC